jgi:hypothetical protein
VTRSLLIDSNLLVLLVVGMVNESLIEKHRRLRVFDVEDFRWIRDQASAAAELIFVPNVVTETSNLLRYVEDPIRSQLMQGFGVLLRGAHERYAPSKDAAARQEFGPLGLTDAVLLMLAETGAHLVTVDLDLYIAASMAGYGVSNYNHIREARPDFNN